MIDYRDGIQTFMCKDIYSYCLYFNVLIGIVLIALMQKPSMNVWINDHWANRTLDPIFILYSDIFQGYAVAIPAIILLFISRKKFFMMCTLGLMVLILVWCIKEYIIGNIPRPTKLIPLEDYAHVLEDLSIYKENYSFPSGHSTTAFGVTTLLAYFCRNRWASFFLFSIAMGAAFSRIYLLQHFYVDVYAGMILGYAFAIIVMFIFGRYSHISEEPVFRLHKKEKL